MGDEILRKITEKLHHQRAVDFRDYKPSTLGRRIKRRMDATHCTDPAGYLELLDTQPDECANLIDSLLINVTEFFRDPEAWDVIREEVIPRILERKQKGDQIKVWSAGCATGEEPYTIAMLFSEALRGRKHDHEIKVYATDIDERALSIARRGAYGDKAMASVPEQLRESCFRRHEDWVVSREIRKMVIFGRHNLVTDAPISHCDLIICRNVLIYMGVKLQNELLSKFHDSLDTPGFMFLGKAEAMLTLSRLFSSVNDRAHVFAKEAPGGAVARVAADQRAVGAAVDAGAAEHNIISLFNEAVLRHAPDGVIAVDGSNVVRLMNPAAERIWGIKSRDLLGRSLVDMALPPSLQGLVQRAVQVRQDKREFTIDELQIANDRGRESCVSVRMTPMFDVRGKSGGVIILAEDITVQVDLKKELEATNEELNSINEEMETTNEELQSTNEELVTTNEELQSTNEELETTNEELQSTNEELETTNDELEARTHEVHRVKDDLEAQNAELETLNGALVKEATERKRAEEELTRAYDREHRIADTLQAALLSPTRGALGDLAYEVRYRAAWEEAEVGGDFGAVTLLVNDLALVALGDVSGKGLEAAVLGSMARNMLLGFASETPAPADMLSRLNDAICANSVGDYFITLVYVLIDLKANSVRFGSAGHEPAIYLSSETGETLELAATGPALGIAPSAKYRSRKISLAPKDTLFLYTDGLSEAGHRKQMLGAEGLASLLRKHSSKSLSKMHDAVYDTATQLSDGKLADDAASVLVRLKG